jgi:hypothetical protein
LITSPILNLPKKDKPYALYTDALKEGLGTILMLDRMVIVNAS